MIQHTVTPIAPYTDTIMSGRKGSLSIPNNIGWIISAYMKTQIAPMTYALSHRVHKGDDFVCIPPETRLLWGGKPSSWGLPNVTWSLSASDLDPTTWFGCVGNWCCNRDEANAMCMVDSNTWRWRVGTGFIHPLQLDCSKFYWNYLRLRWNDTYDFNQYPIIGNITVDFRGKLKKCSNNPSMSTIEQNNPSRSLSIKSGHAIIRVYIIQVYGKHEVIGLG